jgi:hypothetical protein
MSIKIKQTKLMGKADQKKKSQPKKAAPKQAPVQQQASAPTLQVTETKKPKMGLWVTLAVVAVVALITPKPRLITYEAKGHVTQSIYWPGFLFIEGKLFDSTLSVDEQQNGKVLYICDKQNQSIGCQKFKLVQEHNLIETISYYFSH